MIQEDSITVYLQSWVNSHILFLEISLMLCLRRWKWLVRLVSLNLSSLISCHLTKIDYHHIKDLIITCQRTHPPPHSLLHNLFSKPNIPTNASSFKYILTLFANKDKQLMQCRRFWFGCINLAFFYFSLSNDFNPNAWGA